MARRQSARQDSLELLLDTICNTFGGVLFIAILVVLLLQQTGNGPDGPPAPHRPVSEVEMLSLTNRLDAITAELARLSETRVSQEATVASFAPAEIRALIEQRRDATTRQNALQAEVDQLRVENAKSSARTEAVRAENERVRVSLAKAVEKKRRAEQTLEQERLARVEEVRLPVIRPAFGKREIGLILRYGRLYVWHRYGAGNERLGLNTDEFVVVAEEDDSLVTRPIPTKGIPLDDSNASREAIRRTLSRFDAKSCCLAVIVRPDSYGVFKQVRDQAIALKFDYRLMPTEADSPIADRGGTGGKVQ